jgi:hypothetical protein
MTSRQAVRLILILMDPYSESDVNSWNERIKSRFTQVKSWEKLDLFDDRNVTILSGEVAPAAINEKAGCLKTTGSGSSG